MNVAVVIPCIGVDPLLVRCVERCAEGWPEAEIVVLLDDADGAEAIAHRARVIETGPVTIAEKRNRGVAATDARHVAFIDSDAYPAPGWLDRAVELLEADPGLGAVGGPDVSPPDQPRTQRAVGAAQRSFLVKGWWRYRKVPGAAARDVRALPSCNLVVRRADYDALGGMRADLFTAEDTDFCARLDRAGRRLRFDPGVQVFHKDRGLRAFVIQRYTFGVAMVPLLRLGTSPEAAYTAVSAVPAGAVLFLASGALIPAVPAWRRPWRAGAGLLAAAVAVEAVRLGRRRPTEIPLVAVALLIGHLGPGVGILARAAGFGRDLRGVYRNDR